MTNKELLKQVWETCTFDEIIDAGFEYNKCSAEQLINAASEFENPEQESDDKSIQDKFEELLEKYSKDLPWCADIMSILEDYYHQSSMMDYFDNDDLIEHLDGTWEMDAYLKENQIESDDEVEEYTFEDFKNEVEELPNWKFRNFLCDIFMLGHHGSDEELINKLKERIL